MTNEELKRWAMIGLETEIAALDLSIRRAKLKLLQNENRELILKDLEVNNIRAGIEERSAKKEELECKLFDLEWND